MEEDYNSKYNSNSLEVDINQVADFFIRKKILILLFGIIGILGGCLFSLNDKKIWTGNFQIVLKVESDGNISRFGIPGVAGDSKRLRTEIEILKSPSTLLKVYDFAKDNKVILNSKKKFRFKDWKKKLNINLEQGTTVLNIKYTDNDKNLIIPVLNKISTIYSNYSGNKRDKKLDIELDFYKQQIEKYKTQSFESLKRAQDYATKNDLAITTIINQDSEIDKEIPNVLDIEKIRIEASDKIKNIEFQLEQLQSIGSDSEKLVFLAKSISQMDSEKLIRLENIDNQLEKKSYYFTDQDDTVIKLKEQRIIAIKILKKEIKSTLEIQKLIAEARLKESERPSGVLVKYRSLMRDSFKDRSTLNNFENQYRKTLIAKAKSKQPWELITKPTLNPDPVNLSLIEFVFLGFVLSITLGIFLSIIEDLLATKIQSKFQIFDLSKKDLEIAEEIKLNEEKNYNEKLKYFQRRLELKNLNPFFLNVNNFNNSNIDKFLKKLIKNKNNISNNLYEALNHQNIILIIFENNTLKNEVKEVVKKIQNLNKNFLGFIYISNYKVK